MGSGREATSRSHPLLSQSARFHLSTPLDSKRKSTSPPLWVFFFFLTFSQREVLLLLLTYFPRDCCSLFMAFVLFVLCFQICHVGLEVCQPLTLKITENNPCLWDTWDSIKNCNMKVFGWDVIVSLFPSVSEPLGYFPVMLSRALLPLGGLDISLTNRFQIFTYWLERIWDSTRYATSLEERDKKWLRALPIRRGVAFGMKARV